MQHQACILDITEDLLCCSVPFCHMNSKITMRISLQISCLVLRCNFRLFPVNGLLNMLLEMTCNYVKGRLSVKVYLKVLVRRYTRMLLGRNCWWFTDFIWIGIDGNYHASHHVPPMKIGLTLTKCGKKLLKGSTWIFYNNVSCSFIKQWTEWTVFLWKSIMILFCFQRWVWLHHSAHPTLVTGTHFTSNGLHGFYIDISVYVRDQPSEKELFIISLNSFAIFIKAFFP